MTKETCRLVSEELRAKLHNAVDEKVRTAEHFREYYRNTGDKEQYSKLDGKVKALSDIRLDIDQVLNEFCKKYS